jgi:ATP-dependent 26S proteasome regulatory subunit
VLETGIKDRLLSSASTGLLFSAAGVDSNVIAWNRVVLLHGPPGTGKTSLCQGLAQKLSIRLGHRFPAAQLLEINAHSLFSKWFSESGKLVQKLFDHIHELLDDADTLVFVLIGESIVHSP